MKLYFVVTVTLDCCEFCLQLVNLCVLSSQEKAQKPILDIIASLHR